MKCAECGAQVPEGNRFCGACGASLQPGQTAVLESRYVGALLVSRFLWVVGWLVAIAGLVAGIALSLSYECESGQCDRAEVTAVRLGILLGCVLGGLVYGAVVLAIAYVVTLLSDIEINTR
jgi:hypothetical protein